jgi:hypothetical protein
MLLCNRSATMVVEPLGESGRIGAFILGDPNKPIARRAQSMASASPALVLCPASRGGFDLFRGNPPEATKHTTWILLA